MPTPSTSTSSSKRTAGTSTRLRSSALPVPMASASAGARASAGAIAKANPDVVRSASRSVNFQRGSRFRPAEATTASPTRARNGTASVLQQVRNSPRLAAKLQPQVTTAPPSSASSTATATTAAHTASRQLDSVISSNLDRLTLSLYPRVGSDVREAVSVTGSSSSVRREGPQLRLTPRRAAAAAATAVTAAEPTTPPGESRRSSLDFMELRDGKRLDTTPGKVVLIRSPRRPSPVRQLVFAREDEHEAAEGVAEPSVIAGHASPVARLANSLRLATGSISSRLFGASPSSSSAVPRPTSITDTQPSIAILPRAQTPASPFDDDDDGDRFNHAVDNNVQWNDDVLDDDDMASIAPTDFTPMATHRLRSSTPTLEESERRWIRDVAAWTSRYGIEWDSLVVALLALYKFVSLPVRLTARFLFRVWTIYARIVQALGVEGFQSTVTSAVVVLVCMWAVQATYTWSHASIDAPSKMDMDVPQVDVAATVPHHSILDALVERVTSLESAVANLASAATAAETPAAILELEKKVLSMEHQLNTVTMRVDNESKRYGDAIDDTAETLLATKERLEAVAGTMHTLVQDVSQMAAAKGHLVDYEKLAEGIIKKVANNELESLVAALRDSGAVSSENTENDSMMSRENIIAVIREELRTVEAEMERREQAFLAKQQQQPQQTSDRLTVDETQIEAHMVQAIVDRALARFDADRLALPDYALRSAGARILRHRGLTSKIFIDDYGYEKAAKRGGANGGGLVGWVQRLVMPVRKLPVPPPSANPPEIVIDGDSQVGRCWSFAGDHGQLTVLLAKSVRPTNITIEHPAKTLWPDTRCAVKEFEVWAAPLSAASRELLFNTNRRAVGEPSFLDSVHASFADSIKTRPRGAAVLHTDSGSASFFPLANDGPLGGSAHPADASTSPPASKKAVKLGTFTYDVNHPSSMQTFPLDMRGSDVEMDVMQVRVRSNWGHGQYTCMYRVRVHGMES